MAPEEIHGVSQSYFSVARYYGGCKYQGVEYVYDADTDRLIRKDVLEHRRKEEANQQAEKRKQAKAEQDAMQGELF